MKHRAQTLAKDISVAFRSMLTFFTVNQLVKASDLSPDFYGIDIIEDKEFDEKYLKQHLLSGEDLAILDSFDIMARVCVTTAENTFGADKTGQILQKCYVPSELSRKF